MKRRIKVMAAMLACLAMLATAAPSQAMQQADAAAGAFTTVNGTSYVYPMDCGLVYDTACFSTGHYADAENHPDYKGNHWGSSAMMIEEIPDKEGIRFALEAIGIDNADVAAARYMNIFNEAISLAYTKWGDVITNGGKTVTLEFGGSNIANQTPGRTETQQAYAPEDTAAGNAAPNGLEGIGATSTPGEDNEPEPPSSAPIPSLPLTQETDQATSLLPDGSATGECNTTIAWMEETPAVSTLITGEPENAEDERTTTAYEPTEAPDEEEANGPQETLILPPSALIETVVTAPDTLQQSQPVPEEETLGHSEFPAGQSGASGPEEANANSDSEGERLMVTERGGNHGIGNVCIKINLEGLLNQGYIGPNLTDDQMKTHLANMLAHEMGHMLGMTHSIKMTDKKPSIMWPTYAIGED
ncbi:MAG: matrixin family metalloprotease, partial [Christensenellaceae bacterium]